MPRVLFFPIVSERKLCHNEDSMVPKTPNTSKSSTRSSFAVANVLRERIHSGHYQTGEWLPTERVLTEDLRVHRRVVRTAIDQLVQEGLISRRPHCRPVIAEPARSLVRTPSGTAVVSPLSPSRLVALVMWHGGSLEQGGTAQQRIFWGINQALGQAGYHAVFLDLGEEIGSDTENAAREAAHLRYALDQGLGGVIFYAYAYQHNRELIQQVSRRIPLCLIDRALPGVEADFVGINNYQGMFDATTHLIQQGHRRIAYITKGEPINPVQDRLQGYLRALHTAFGGDADEMVLTAPSYTDRAWSVFDTLFRLPEAERPTAVLAFNDYEAVRAAERLQRLNLRVPQDVALAGFDSIVKTLPNGIGLTSVAQPFEELGRTAANTFLRRIESPSILPAYIELPAQLILRESSGPGPGAQNKRVRLADAAAESVADTGQRQ
jgi:LacI family transcriptional regulator